MNATDPAPQSLPRPGRLVLRAWSLGAWAVVLVGAGTIAAGLSERWQLAVLAGALAASLAAIASAALLVTQAMLPASHPAVLRRYLIAIAGSFLVHLLAVAAGMVAVRARPSLVGAEGTDAAAAFGLACASASSIQLFATALVVAGALRARSARASAAR
jgi:hypothetical protein